MPTYSTAADLTRRYGRRVLAALAPDGHGETIETLAADAQLEAAAEIDLALTTAGYTTPVDTSAITDADQSARAAALLRRLELALTISALSREHADLPENARRDVQWARGVLDQLASTGRIPGLTPAQSVTIHVTQDSSTGRAAVPSRTTVDQRTSVAGSF